MSATVLAHAPGCELVRQASSRPTTSSSANSLRPLAYRSLQWGLAGEASRRYADEWTVGITDVTPLTHEVRARVCSGDLAAAAALLPEERPYPAPGGTPGLGRVS